MIEKLGKITDAKFGFGGYQDVQIVFSFELTMGSSTCTWHTIECGWGHVSKEELSKPGSIYKWTHEDRIKQLGEASWKVFELIKKAKVKSLSGLVGIPVKVFFESEFGPNKGFEILTEVL